MVSLNGNTRQTGQGGMTFFSDSLNSYHDDEPLLDAGMPALPQEEAVSRWMTQEIRKFRTMRSVKAILLAMFFYACLVLSAFLLPAYCGHGECSGQDPNSLMLYVHGATWFLLALVQLYLSQEHRASLLHGYFAFHLATRTLRRLPLLLSSAANAILVVVSQILGAVCSKQDGSCGALTNTTYLQILISLEAAIALTALLIYLVKTVHFNKVQDVPDFLRTSTANDTPRIQRQIGYRGGQRSYREEKREAMTVMWYEVLYWKHKRVDLCREILALQDQLDHLGRPQ
ncbi:transmembrane protein 192-like isoform X2 [Babylonia areolata]|uniref:transmembrane protein 192-like isoform X2 n=1 Tax=Babylonia areolata TaxID=304850 RepID=UPI003FD13EF5